MDRYDAIVVGARCAGATTAMLLARQGRRVLLLDRATFPKDTLSTLYIQLPGIAMLEDWGLLEKVRATGCPPLVRTAYHAAGITVTGASRPLRGQQFNYAPRRFLLDQLLIDAAVEAGAELRQATTVGEILAADGRVYGVRCRTAGGAWVTERADLAIGADGMRSRVAAEVKAEVLAGAAPKSCAYYGFWDLPSDNVLSMTRADGVLVGWAPTNDAVTVACYLRQHEFARAKRDPLGVYLDTIRRHHPVLHEQLRTAEPVDRLYGTGDQQNFVRQPAGPGWALVGDAAVHIDSITAWGISAAFNHAQILADKLAAAATPDQALTEYADTLRQISYGGYQATLKAADLNLDSNSLSYLATLAENPELSDLFFSMSSTAITPQEYRAAYQAATEPQPEAS